MLVAVSAICFLAMSVGSPAQAQAGLTAAERAELAQRFSPILYLHPDEAFYPVSAEYAVAKSDLKNIYSGTSVNDPSASLLATITDTNSGYYLDNRVGTINDEGIIEDFLTGSGAYPPVVYSRVTAQNYGGRGVYAVQYFFYYPFNNGPLNTHEGDWETVMVVCDMAGEPIFAAYSQHLDGGTAPWELVDTVGHRTKVYVARGSHANYFRPYEGALGPAQDECSDSGRVLSPEDYGLVPIESQSWLGFAGCWGDYGRESSGMLGERGPVGPAYQGERWDVPMAWSESLKEVTEMSLRVNWTMHYIFWIVLGIMGLVFLVTIFVILRRKKKQGTLGPRLLPFLYIGGGSLKSAASILVILAMVIGVASYFLPWYSIGMDIDAGQYSTPGPVEVLRTNGIDGMSFNRPEPGAGLVQVVGIPVPAGFLMLVGLFIFIFSSIGVMKTRKYGCKLFRRGFAVLMPAIVLIAQVSLIGYIVEGYVQDVPPEVMDIIDTVSANPLGGSTTGTIGEYGVVTLEWGIGPGIVLMLVAAILLFIAAIMLIADDKAYFRPGHPGMWGQPYGQQQAYPNYQPGYGQYQGPYGQPPVYVPPAQYGPPPATYQPAPEPYMPEPIPQPPPEPVMLACPNCGFTTSVMPGTAPFRCHGCEGWVYPPMQ